ncbi:MAG: TonB family protein [Candidatus Omnitrophica bacterium]|nr:TonB family protein [Candidatus Omnitrophota bacterium]
MKRKFLSCLIILCFIFSAGPKGFCENPGISSTLIEEDMLEEIEMVVGDIHILQANLPTRVSIRNPEVIDVRKIDDKEIVLTGKTKGVTYFVFWDKEGEHPFRVKVLPEDTDYLTAQVQKILNSLKLPEVYLKPLKEEGKVLMLGKIDKFEDKERLKSALGELSPRITDLIEVKSGDLVEITSEVLELRRDSSQELGIEWPTSINISELAGKWNTLERTGDAFFHINHWTRAEFSATIDFLVREGKARILSRPHVTCESGKEAELTVGGEVPIFSTTAVIGGATGTNVEYKEFGIKLKVAPVVDKEKRIKLTLNVDISEVGEAVSIGTTSALSNTTTALAYPISKRTVSTQLYLNDGETLVIGGLIKQKTDEDLKKFPWLADVPILGMFFRHKEVRTGGGSPNREDTELFITLTPKIITMESRIPEKDKLIQSTKKEFQAFHAQDNLSEELQSYILGVQKKISDNITYPASLLNTGWEGVVVVKLNLASSGELRDVQMVKSSGYKIFDEEAERLVRSLSYSPFPPNVDLRTIKIEVPIIYRERSKR